LRPARKDAPLKGFAERMAEKASFVDRAVGEIDLTGVHDEIGVPVKYALSSGGKRLRPLICMLCAEAVGGDYKKTKDVFLALELIHNGTLVHDDILDEDLFRRGRPSTQSKFGGKTSVLTGDGLLSLGLKYAADTGDIEVVRLLSETALKMVQGVALQTLNRGKVISEEEYFRISYLKSGSLFEAAAAIGGMIASADSNQIEKLAEFGRNFGNAYQVRDDLLGVHGGEDLTRSDIINGDISIPLIYALESERLQEEDREMITSTYGGQGKMDVDVIRRIYDETGALERSMERMRGFAGRAGDVLADLLGEAESDLKELLDKYFFRENIEIIT